MDHFLMKYLLDASLWAHINFMWYLLLLSLVSIKIVYSYFDQKNLVSKVIDSNDDLVSSQRKWIFRDDVVYKFVIFSISLSSIILYWLAQQNPILQEALCIVFGLFVIMILSTRNIRRCFSKSLYMIFYFVLYSIITFYFNIVFAKFNGITVLVFNIPIPAVAWLYKMQLEEKQEKLEEKQSEVKQNQLKAI